MITLMAAPPRAAAEPLQLGVFFGPHLFSKDAEIGAKETYRTYLESTFTLGPRLAMPLLPWLVPEAELPLAVATTHDLDITVLWVEPRAHLRFIWPRGKLQPFAVLGGGIPMTMSTKRGQFGTDISLEGYGGIGAAFSPGRGLSFRLDLRVGLGDGIGGEAGSPIAVETEITVGLWFDLEGRRIKRPRQDDVFAEPVDSDRDGFLDPDDGCPDRPEDDDSFEDKDGCPEIDNDMDTVLDIADACLSVPEVYNGFEDDDGCPDTVPSDLTEVLGTIEGLLYTPGLTEVRDAGARGLDRIAAVLGKYASVRVLIIGHSDDREAVIEQIEDEPDEDRAQRQIDALVALSQERAAAVEQALIERGITTGRIDAVGKGAEDPVSENDKPRGRLRNRRVELQLYVPIRGLR